jgi:solute:Na+ symporter, SSS family
MEEYSMTFNGTTLSIVVLYLLGTMLLGLWQSRRIKKSKEFTVSKISLWRAATFLAGMTLGGGATYGVAGDTVKFGLTYLLWFPISIALGWWVTGLLFARYYYRCQGLNVPTLIEQRFDKRTRLVCSLSTLVYGAFVLTLELYALTMIFRALAPGLSMAQATLFSMIVCVLSVSFSGILGASLTNMVHISVITLAFLFSLMILWRAVGGWNEAVGKVIEILPILAHPGIDARVWLSVTGLGWGATGQILLAKAGRLGGVSVVSNLAASCRSEKEAVISFWLAGLLSGIPAFLSSMVGVLTAAFLGTHMTELPVYASIGWAMIQLNPILAGFLLAAVAGAILSSFGPAAIVFSSVFTEDIIEHFYQPRETQKRILYSGVIIMASCLAAFYIITIGIDDILPFLYTTAFPTTVPLTVVMLFGIYSKKADSQSAFWAITIGVPAALIWGLLLNNPWGIPNIYIAFLVSIGIMSLGVVRSRIVAGKTWQTRITSKI